MKVFFKDIFEYHNHFNQKLIAQLIVFENELPERTIPLFAHSINAQQIWNARITGKEKLGIHQLHTLQECAEIDIVNYQDTLRILDECNLEEKIVYSNSKGTEYSNTIQQILFHVANHFSHHKGQIISDLRQSGIDPIVTDYIFYKR
jgi:uncharacterized damage-inducible protein DinB